MLKRTLIKILFLLTFLSGLTACVNSEPNIKEIQTALAEEAEYLLGRPDPNNYGLSLEGLIKAYDFKKVHGFIFGDFYVVRVDYKVKLIKPSSSLTPEQRQAAISAFRSSEQGREKTIRNHELKLEWVNGAWQPSHREK